MKDWNVGGDKPFGNLYYLYKYSCRLNPDILKQRKSFMERFCRVSGTSSKKPDGKATVLANTPSSQKYLPEFAKLFAVYPEVNISHAASFFMILDLFKCCMDCRFFSGGMSISRLYLTLSEIACPKKASSGHETGRIIIPTDSCLGMLLSGAGQKMSALPSFELLNKNLRKYFRYYLKMQAFLNLENGLKKEAILGFGSGKEQFYDGIYRWEFSAAASSPLCLFMHYAAANGKGMSEEESKSIDSVYFPWISGLQVLLDSLASSRRDHETGAFNFTDLYSNQKECGERIAFFMDRALQGSVTLRHPEFHLRLIKGLTALYLSDPEAGTGLSRLTVKKLLSSCFPGTKSYYTVCRVLRAAGKL